MWRNCCHQEEQELKVLEFLLESEGWIFNHLKSLFHFFLSPVVSAIPLGGYWKFWYIYRLKTQAIRKGFVCASLVFFFIGAYLYIDIYGYVYAYMGI